MANSDKLKVFEFRSSSASAVADRQPIFGNLLTAISCLLLFLAVVGFLTNGGGVNASLQSFMSALSRAPVVSTEWCQSLVSFTIQGDWGAFDFLKEFFNSFVGFVGVFGYLAVGIAQALVFCAYFVAYIF